MAELFGGIEGGGTKFICAVGSGPDDIRAETRFPTTTPQETLGKAIAFFQEQQAIHGQLNAIGLACFGPLDPNLASPGAGDGLHWYDVCHLSIDGRGWTDTAHPFDRLPARAEKIVPAPVWELSHHTAGMTVRFATAGNRPLQHQTTRRQRIASGSRSRPGSGRARRSSTWPATGRTIISGSISPVGRKSRIRIKRPKATASRYPASSGIRATSRISAIPSRSPPSMAPVIFPIAEEQDHALEWREGGHTGRIGTTVFNGLFQVISQGCLVAQIAGHYSAQ